MLKILPLICDFHASQGLILRIVLCDYIVWFCFGLFFAIRMSTFVSTYGRSEFGLKKKSPGDLRQVIALLENLLALSTFESPLSSSS